MKGVTSDCKDSGGSENPSRHARGHVLASLDDALHFSDSDVISVLECFREPGAMSQTGGQSFLASGSGSQLLVFSLTSIHSPCWYKPLVLVSCLIVDPTFFYS